MTEYDTAIVVSPLLKAILDRLKSMADKHSYGVLLKKTVAALQTVAAVIDDAEEKSKVSSAVRGWLQRLQDVLDEVDDLIDELQITSARSNSQLMIPKQVSVLSLSRFNPFSQQPKIGQPVQTIANRLNLVAREATYFSLLEYDEHGNENVHKKLYYDNNPRYAVGLMADKIALIELICNSVDQADGVSLPVIPIVGVMGVGKSLLTTLIWVDTDKELKCRFEREMRVSLVKEYNDNDKREIFRRLLGENKAARDVEEMKMQLEEMLGKRYLLVLNEFDESHMNLVTILKDMKPSGSAIVVTTRSHRAASLVGTTPPYRLEPLSLDYSYQLLELGADFHRGSRHLPGFEPIARDLAKLCSGVPLILRMVAKHLRDQGLSAWEDMLKTLQYHGFVGIRGGSAGGHHDDLLPRSPYLDLPLASLCLQKPCGLSVETLTCVWMALGFLYSDDPTQQQQSPEHIAGKYVREIIELGLCSDVTYAPGGVVSRIEFPDALLDFVTCSARQQWWFTPHRRSSHALATIARYLISLNRARYIVWDADGLPSSILLPSRVDHVRLFILRIRGQASAELVDDIVSGFKRLRVLGFGGCDIEMLPDSIAELKHLRYLDVGRNARMKRLPDSVCDLWLLQTLFLHGCSQLEQLPLNIGRLQNLRYLSLTILKESLPEAIGRLISLRTLALIGCPRLASLPTSLKNPNNLHTLGIFGCQQLDLTANSSVEGFKGLESIHTLLLSHLPKFAGLHSDLGYPSGTMEHLLIQSCPSLPDTKWITQFRSLCSLTIEDCPQLPALMLTDATSQLRCLVELVIRRCPSLRDTTWIRQFKSLRSLIIHACLKLVELDAAFSELRMLQRLEVTKCPGLAKWFASGAADDWWLNIPLHVMKFDRARLLS